MAAQVRSCRALSGLCVFCKRGPRALPWAGLFLHRWCAPRPLGPVPVYSHPNSRALIHGDGACYVSIVPRDSTLTVAAWLESQCASAGTNFHAIFQRANRAYDRIVILSDMQGWIGHTAPVASCEAWAKKHRAAPRIFSFDLAGHGTLQFPQRDVFCLAGFSDKTLETLKHLDTDQAAFVRQIEAVEL